MNRIASFLTALLLAVCFLGTEVLAQKQEKTGIPIEKIWASGDLWPSSVYGVNWMKDGAYYSTQEQNQVVKYDIRKGKAVETLFDGDAAKLQLDDYALSASEKKILLQTAKESIYRHSYTADYYIAEMGSKEAKPLDSEGRQSYATFSPDEEKIAFVRDNNLFYKDLKTGTMVQVTNDGANNKIINGSTDWVYEEEFAITKAFFWSPDGKKIAYLKFDESHVPEYNMQTWGDLYPADYRFKYPKAGDSNSTVQVFVYDLGTKKSNEIEVGAENDQYIPRMQWTQDPNLLSIRRMNRLQNKLEVLHANLKTGELKPVYVEKNETYIDIHDDLIYLEDGKQFLLSSDRSGFRHFYLYDMEGKLINPITKGDWQVDEFLGVDEKNKRVYYTSTEESPLERHPYSIGLDGSKKKQLAKGEGTHDIELSKSFAYFLDYHSTANSPESITLKSTEKDEEIRVLEDNQKVKQNLEEYETGKLSFDQLKTKEGTKLNYYMIKPQDFDKNKQYPLLMFVYGGPGSQQVKNGWLGPNYYWFQHLAAKGYIVACVDNRGTGGRGADFQKSTYAKLGELELKDQISAAKYFRDLDYIQDDRIGIWGWSFGGYMTSLCLTKSDGLFRMGIAVAPVTNWRFYDTIYTERYLKTPQENPEGYDQNSPLFFADGLKGEFLLVHGTGDDNVHLQNSMEFTDALINANKQFEHFYYPNKNHGIYGGITRYHLYKKMTDFVEKNL